MQPASTELKFTLRTARLVNELTQVQAARALGISTCTLSGYEHEESYPDVPMIKRMEKLYGIRYDQMMFQKLK